MMPTGWLQQQMRAAETLLNAVDTAVMKTVSHTADGADPGADGEGPAGQLPAEGDGGTSSTGFVYAASTSPFGTLGASPSRPQDAASSGRASRPAAPAREPPSSSVGLSVPQPSPGKPIDGIQASQREPQPQPESAARLPTTTAELEPVIQPRVSSSLSASGAAESGLDRTLSGASAAPKTVLPLPASMAVSSKRSGGSTAPANQQLPTLAPGPATEGGPGTAREQQLTRMVEQLKERLRSSKIEAEQLEDMLAQAEARCERERALMGQFQGELAAVAESKALMEAALHAQLNQQALAMQEAQQRSETLARQVLALEGQLAIATESSRSMLQNRTDMEGGMLQALRSQLSTVETQLDMERRAHTSTRQAAIARERELEAASAGTTAALGEMQRSLQQGVHRVHDLEDALALATARQRELEHQLNSKQGNTAQDTANQDMIQEIHQLQNDLERQREACQQAVAACAVAQAEAKNLRAELDQLHTESEQSVWRKDAARLEASLREANELLYTKQSAIERLSADRAALQLRLEREVAAASRSKAETDHHTLIMTDQQHRPAVMSSPEPSLVPTGSVLGERYRRLASRPDKLGTALAAAAALVDRTASITSHLLRQYPIVRLVAGCYLLLLHLYVYVVTLSMQHAAVVLEDSSTSDALSKAASA